MLWHTCILNIHIHIMTASDKTPVIRTPVLTSPGGGCSVLLSDEFPDCPLVSCCLEPESTSPPTIHKLRSLNILPGTSSFYIVLYIRKNISSFLFHWLILYSMYVPGLNMAGEDWEEGMTLNRLVGTWEEVDDALLLFRTSTYLGTEPTTNQQVKGYYCYNSNYNY